MDKLFEVMKENYELSNTLDTMDKQRKAIEERIKANNRAIAVLLEKEDNNENHTD